VRAQTRERLHGAITAAALALYTPGAGEPVTDEWLANIKPGTVGEIDPETNFEVAPHENAIAEGMTLLMVHFGHDSPIVRSYVDTCTVSLKAERTKARHFGIEDEGDRIERIGALLDILREAQVARDEWMQQARARVNAM
jgi:hypothetical protein